MTPVTGNHPLPRGTLVTVRAQWRGGTAESRGPNLGAFAFGCSRFADPRGFARPPQLRVVPETVQPLQMTLGQDLQAGDFHASLSFFVSRDVLAGQLYGTITTAFTNGSAVNARSVVIVDQDIPASSSPSAWDIVLQDIHDDPTGLLSDIADGVGESLGGLTGTFADVVKPLLVPLIVIVSCVAVVYAVTNTTAQQALKQLVE